jgi:hypothetical protein
MANPAALGHAFLHNTLTGDVTLMGLALGGIHRGSAKVGTPTPLVVVAYQAGRDISTMNGYRMITKCTFQVKAVGPARDTPDIISVANRLDDLLKRTSGTVTGGKIDACYVIEPLQYDENLPTGEKISHFGALYRLEIEQA